MGIHLKTSKTSHFTGKKLTNMCAKVKYDMVVFICYPEIHTCSVVS